jgi:hypothetical protein
MTPIQSLETKRKTIGQVLACVGCCCGRTDRGKPPVPVDWLKAEWKQRKLLKTIQLTISGCLGPCDLVNVVCLVTPQRTVWLGGLTEQEHFDALLGWATQCGQRQTKFCRCPHCWPNWNLNAFNR